MFRALLLFFLLAFAGCESPQPVEKTPTSVSRADIESQVQFDFGMMGEVADRDYLLPSKEWITGDFANSWLKFKAALGEWTPEENDCDDFSRAAAFFAQLINHDTKHKPNAALAFGEFWFRRHDGVNHAINFFVYRDGADQHLKIGFFEPQACSVVTLSKEEINSCFAWRL